MGKRWEFLTSSFDLFRPRRRPGQRGRAQAGPLDGGFLRSASPGTQKLFSEPPARVARGGASSPRPLAAHAWSSLDSRSSLGAQNSEPSVHVRGWGREKELGKPHPAGGRERRGEDCILAQPSEDVPGSPRSVLGSGHVLLWIPPLGLSACV